MTNQTQGEILFGGWTGASDQTTASTPWMPVRGDYATFGVEVKAVSGLSVSWDVQTRTAEDPGTTISLFGWSAATTGVNSVLSTKVSLQWVRYIFKTTGSGTANWAVLRALAPSWQVDR